MIYLATPYTHKDESVMQDRFEQAQRVFVEFTRQRKVVFAPIVFCHPTTVVHKLPRDAEFWRTFNVSYMKSCDKLIVVCINGWKDSRGVHEEIELAKILNIPIEYMEPIE